MRGLLCVAGAILVASSAVALVACDDSSNAVKETPIGTDSGPSNDSGPTPDSGGIDSGGDGGPGDCVQNPKTHLEIINACTNATKIPKNPVLPKLLPDGGLPPLN